MKKIFILLILIFFCVNVSATTSIFFPNITGQRYEIFNYSLADLTYYINDHCIIYNGSNWHAIGITDQLGESPSETMLVHAYSPTPYINNTFLPDGNWTKTVNAATANLSNQESHLWAPHCLNNGSDYLMLVNTGFYNDSLGGFNHSMDGITVFKATASNLTTWKRACVAWRDGAWNTDPFVLKINSSTYVSYYSATEYNVENTALEGVFSVIYRFSNDDSLCNWTDRKGFALKTNYKASDSYTCQVTSESPQVFNTTPNDWYLTTGRSGTSCYRVESMFYSNNPFSFNMSYIGNISTHATEFVTDQFGINYSTDAGGWLEEGLYLYRTTWDNYTFEDPIFNPGLGLGGNAICTDIYNYFLVFAGYVALIAILFILLGIIVLFKSGEAKWIIALGGAVISCFLAIGVGSLIFGSFCGTG